MDKATKDAKGFLIWREKQKVIPPPTTEEEYKARVMRSLTRANKRIQERRKG